MPTLLNAFDKSRKATRTEKDGFASKTVNISCEMAESWCTLESLVRNPDWLLFNKQFSFKNS